MSKYNKGRKKAAERAEKFWNDKGDALRAEIVELQRKLKNCQSAKSRLKSKNTKLKEDLEDAKKK